MGTPVINNSTQESDENCLRQKSSENLLKKFNMSIDAEEVKKICAIYDWDGKGELDMYYFMDIFYALGFNLTKKVTVKYGQTDDFGKKFCKFDEIVSLMQQAIKEPEHTGNYHDYVELCRLYDKNENGTMMLAELDTFLVMKSQRKMSLNSLKSFATKRMMKVSFHMFHSLIDCVEKLKKFKKKLVKTSQSFECMSGNLRVRLPGGQNITSISYDLLYPSM